jgi:hypothetical protein
MNKDFMRRVRGYAGLGGSDDSELSSIVEYTSEDPTSELSSTLQGTSEAQSSTAMRLRDMESLLTIEDDDLEIIKELKSEFNRISYALNPGESIWKAAQQGLQLLPQKKGTLVDLIKEARDLKVRADLPGGSVTKPGSMDVENFDKFMKSIRPSYEAFLERVKSYAEGIMKHGQQPPRRPPHHILNYPTEATNPKLVTNFGMMEYINKLANRMLKKAKSEMEKMERQSFYDNLKYEDLIKILEISLAPIDWDRGRGRGSGSLDVEAFLLKEEQNAKKASLEIEKAKDRLANTHFNDKLESQWPSLQVGPLKPKLTEEGRLTEWADGRKPVDQEMNTFLKDMFPRDSDDEVGEAKKQLVKNYYKPVGYPPTESSGYAQTLKAVKTAIASAEEKYPWLDVPNSGHPYYSLMKSLYNNKYDMDKTLEAMAEKQKEEASAEEENGADGDEVKGPGVTSLNRDRDGDRFSLDDTKETPFNENKIAELTRTLDIQREKDKGEAIRLKDELSAAALDTAKATAAAEAAAKEASAANETAKEQAKEIKGLREKMEKMRQRLAAEAAEAAAAAAAERTMATIPEGEGRTAIDIVRELEDARRLGTQSLQTGQNTAREMLRNRKPNARFDKLPTTPRESHASASKFSKELKETPFEPGIKAPTNPLPPLRNESTLGQDKKY